MDQATLKSLISYDPESGSFRWRPRASCRFDSDARAESWNNRYAGSEAGCVTTGKTGYKRVVIRVNEVLYVAHRLAWLYMEGELPENEVDHINRDATDNRWSNLRLVDRRSNSMNSSMSSSNTSGVVGVSWDKSRGKWSTKVKVRGNTINLGRFKHEDLDKAEARVRDFRASIGFSEGHGSTAPYREA